MADLDPEHLNRRRGVQGPDVRSAASPVTALPEPPRLANYLKDVPNRRKRRWKSATVIMERVLDDKISEVPTSVMSVNTRAIVSQSQLLLRWNDKFYEYLPSYVVSGNVGAVKALLSAGRNPGAAEKPRWDPIHNAIKAGLTAILNVSGHLSSTALMSMLSDQPMVEDLSTTPSKTRCGPAIPLWFTPCLLQA